MVATYIKIHHIDIINIYKFYYGILYMLETFILIYPENVCM